MPNALTLMVLTGLVVTAVYTDLRRGKIYNSVTLPCMAFGVLANAVGGGVSGLLSSLAAVGLGLVLYLTLAPLAGIGGGDIKLLMAVGALIGLPATIWTMLITAVIGGIMALSVMIRRRVTGETVRKLAGNVYVNAAFRAQVDLFAGCARMRFAYSPAIALGTFTALILNQWLR